MLSFVRPAYTQVTGCTLQYIYIYIYHSIHCSCNLKCWIEPRQCYKAGLNCLQSQCTTGGESVSFPPGSSGLSSVWRNPPGCGHPWSTLRRSSLALSGAGTVQRKCCLVYPETGRFTKASVKYVRGGLVGARKVKIPLRVVQTVSCSTIHWAVHMVWRLPPSSARTAPDSRIHSPPLFPSSFIRRFGRLATRQRVRWSWDGVGVGDWGWGGVGCATCGQGLSLQPTRTAADENGRVLKPSTRGHRLVRCLLPRPHLPWFTTSHQDNQIYPDRHRSTIARWLQYAPPGRLTQAGTSGDEAEGPRKDCRQNPKLTAWTESRGGWQNRWAISASGQ